MVVIALLFTSIAARPAWDRDELELALRGAGAGAVDDGAAGWDPAGGGDW